ncbi:hypothetical protein ACFVAJ_18370 [Agromyces sp. NPDC057679]|uniref:hypothetical protein n=1 Tax=Agromyces sp. NPDC057679 TaxID=3346207 RepID=UPI00366E7E92
MAASRKSPGDVHWTLPGKKRPFAYSTRATSDLVSVLAGDGHTVDSAAQAVNYDPEAKAILHTMSGAGYGGTVLSELVR